MTVPDQQSVNNVNIQFPMESSDVRFHSWRDKGILILIGRTPVIFKDWLLQNRPGWGGGGKNIFRCKAVEIPFFPRPPTWETTDFFFFFFFFF